MPASTSSPKPSKAPTAPPAVKPRHASEKRRAGLAWRVAAARRIAREAESGGPLAA
jgi:hypothetical protein